MALKDELETEVDKIFRERWSTRDGKVVPDASDLKLGNDGVRLDATVLYADMADSTDLVDGYKDWFAAEIYKAFLTCSARIIKAHGGVITAYDGDRIMAVYIEGNKNTSAVKTALRINWAVQKVIKPKLKERYPDTSFIPGHSVGIDTSKILVARVGVRNDNDLVWVGRAANYAAKLSAFRTDGYSSWITGAVYDKMLDDAKMSGDHNMWEERVWTARNKLRIYRSNWHWAP